MKLHALAAVALSACFSSAQPAQVVNLGPSPAPPWSALRDALSTCTQAQGLAGEVRIRIDIDDDGGAGNISANRGGGELVHCFGATLGAMRFPADHRGRAIEVPFVVKQS